MSLYEKHGLTKEVFYDVLSEIEYNNGVPEALERIHANDIKTVVITGGFKAQADEVRQKFGIDSAVAGCESNWAESGESSDLNVIPLGKFGKMRIVEAYANGYNVTPDQCVYVGDAENDSLALNECGLGIAYNGHEIAVKNSDVQINGTHNKEFRLIADEVIDFFE